MVKAKALIPRTPLLNIVQQAACVISQVMESRQLIVGYGRMFNQVAGFSCDRGDFSLVQGKRQQRTRTPDSENYHQRPGKGLFPRHTDTAATHTGTVVNDTLPGHRQSQGMLL